MAEERVNMTVAPLGKIPVTVLTGFLGAGKTTLLNRIMTEQHGKRIAIIQNEFGEIGIDGALVINADEEIFEMNNGCICCTVRGDLIRILGNLQKRRHKFDYVLIETDGLADPAPVAQTFFVDPDMQESWQLDGIVTVVDAKHLDLHWDTNDEVKEQIAFADRILLNKIDLVESADVDRIERKIRAINAFCDISRTVKSEISVEKVLDIGAFDLRRILELKPQFLEPEVPFEWSGIFDLADGCYDLHFDVGPDPTMDMVLLPISDLSAESLFRARERAVVTFSAQEYLAVGDQSSVIPGDRLYEAKTSEPLRLSLQVPSPSRYILFTQHRPEEFNLRLEKNGRQLTAVFEQSYNLEHEHDSEISSVSLEFEGDLDQQKTNQWVSRLLREKGADIFRMKGIVAFKGQERRFVFHGVHMLFDGIPEQLWGEKRRINQMVFVGKNLDAVTLDRDFRSCLA
jgi:G3E family GTPase